MADHAGSGRKAAAVMMDKSCDAIVAMMGAAYAGSFLFYSRAAQGACAAGMAKGIRLIRRDDR